MYNFLEFKPEWSGVTKPKRFKCPECGAVFLRSVNHPPDSNNYSWWRKSYKSYCDIKNKDVWCKEVKR